VAAFKQSRLDYQAKKKDLARRRAALNRGDLKAGAPKPRKLAIYF